MDNSFYRVYAWMTKILGLRGAERDLFALIYSFTEAGRQMTGGLKYLCAQTGTSKPTVMECLRRLVARDLLVKTVKMVNGVRYCEYRVNEARLSALLPEKDSLPGEDKKAYRPGPDSVPGEDQKAYRPGPDSVPGEDKKAYRPGPDSVPGEDKKTSHPGQKTLPEWERNVTGPGQETFPNIKEYTKENIKGNMKESEAPSRRFYLHFGEYGNVLLTQEEADSLRRDYPDDWQQRINRLSEYMASTGKQYQNHLATIRSWARQDDPKPVKKGLYADLKGGIEL